MLIIPTVLHELYHKYQCKTYGNLIYSLLAFPLWRDFIIEKSAYAVSDIAYDWIQDEINNEFNLKYLELNVQFYRVKF
jgi:hypothetical protein